MRNILVKKSSQTTFSQHWTRFSEILFFYGLAGITRNQKTSDQLGKMWADLKWCIRNLFIVSCIAFQLCRIETVLHGSSGRVVDNLALSKDQIYDLLSIGEDDQRCAKNLYRFEGACLDRRALVSFFMVSMWSSIQRLLLEKIMPRRLHLFQNFKGDADGTQIVRNLRLSCRSNMSRQQIVILCSALN